MTKEQQEVQTAIEKLLILAARYKIYIAGFAFADEPLMISNFGNCNDCSELKLYETLVKVCDRKRARGEVNKINVSETN